MASLAVAAVFATPSDFLTAPLHRRGSHVVTNSSSVSGCLLTKRGDSRRIGQRHRAASLAIRCSSALSPELKSTIDKVVQSQKVVLFMKGTKEFPQCGFSNTVVQVLNSLNVPFDTLNILENEILRHGMKEYSNWPTFPQLYIDGEFFGGCDIVVEAYKAGQLQEVLEKALCS
ncbi:monothiol glutaredoxin-S14, chloroplastic-like [Zingiber officinale]|uniref:monothiol glutaredoxin-S14, chloroplastic-like n=1 Tax=Zingiber officinale TaxID=94328 RepID=UPI001C4CC678|nr:monothiol glutaredoxin-S14, chloroplastic-like [Zingiber officinale]